MTIELNTGMVNNIFNGTYNSIWDIEEADCQECANEGVNCEHGADYDGKEQMQSILEAYQNNQKEVIEIMGVPWVKSIKFTGFYSPREYNFSTDQLDFTLEIDKIGITEYLASLIIDNEFSEWLKENYQSSDGFMSFTPDNYAELADNIINMGSEHDQAVSALINYATKDLSKLEFYNSIEGTVYEDWRSNGYYGLEVKPMEGK